MMEFQNHQHRRMDGTCCGVKGSPDSSSNKTLACLSECSLEFRICIEPFGIPVSLTDSRVYSGPCVYGQTRSGHWGNTDTSYSFQEAPTYVINITNPWPKSFTLILETFDLAPKRKRVLIDRAVHRSILRPINNPDARKQLYDWHHVTSSTQLSGYTFSMRLTCAPNHYTSECTKLCFHNQSRYSCDANGDKVCMPGWSGRECDAAICKVGCHSQHGSCTQPVECVCANGWQGPYCDKCIKYPGCKHGTCDDSPFTCRCLPNWGGAFCDQDLDYCGRHMPCENGGICKNLDSLTKSFNCSCPHQFTGERCEIRLPSCSWNPCKRGQCVPKDDYDYECSCEPGWRGEHCEENIDYCLPNSCLNGGTCQDLDGIGFRCICPPGFKGSNCQLPSPCGNSLCVHARDCTPLIPNVDGMNYKCVCQPGWEGRFCDQNIDDCVDKCQNNGTCHDLIDDFYCTCPKGFYGRNCEIRRECSGEPCQNKGICHETTDGYRCECPSGFTGHNCEIPIGSCDPNPCQNAAYCFTLPQGFYCKCSAAHFGQYCEYDRPYCGPSGCMPQLSPCFTTLDYTNISAGHNEQEGALLRACGPHGTCIPDTTKPGGFACVCSHNYRGKYCQEPVNFCEGSPCLNGGVCINGHDNYECICEEGFSGERCETPVNMCQPNPCQNDGYCSNAANPGDFRCSCLAGWSGRWCQLKTSDPCKVTKVCFNNGTCHKDIHQPGGFRCECEANWMGSVCHLRRPESRACANQALCRNGATCVDVGSSFSCICLPGYEGQYCENDINECNPNPCFNNGTCIDLVNAFECVCPEGFTGVDCRINIDECSTNPCAYGATCIDRVNDYECLCPEGRHGRNCEEVTIYQPPKPPACNFHDRVYDHNETWLYNCQKCQCNMGQIVCEDDFCGYWSCLQAVGKTDRFSCKSGETCHVLPTGQEGDCFVPPCYLRTVCLNSTQSIPAQLRRLMPEPSPGPAIPGCRPNAAQLNNRCAKVTLKFSKDRMPYGVTVGDICTAVKSLPSIVQVANDSLHVLRLGLSCGIQAEESQRNHDTIEITLSHTEKTVFTFRDGTEYSFVQILAQNLSKEIAAKASSNLTLDKLNTSRSYAEDNTPLPPLTQLIGTPHLDLYWHRVLLGVVEISVDTIVVRSKEYGSPVLIPLACGLILLTCGITTVFICVYAQRKRHELLLKYAPKTQLNNLTMSEDKQSNAFANNKHNTVNTSGPKIQKDKCEATPAHIDRSRPVVV